MAPRDHRIHLGRMDSPKTPPQNHSSTKQFFFGTIFRYKNVPEPKCRPKIFPEADFGNFSKSLQKVRTANPSEMLSRTPPSKLQTEPRGEKHSFRICLAKMPSGGLQKCQDVGWMTVLGGLLLLHWGSTVWGTSA